jgi:hypothetical protein
MIFEIFDKSKMNIPISNFDNKQENKNINISQNIENIHNCTKELKTINTINIIEKEQIHEDIGIQINPIYNVSKKVKDINKTYSYNKLNILEPTFGIIYFKRLTRGQKYNKLYPNNDNIKYYKNPNIHSARIPKLKLKTSDFYHKKKADEEKILVKGLSTEKIVFKKDTIKSKYYTLKNKNKVLPSNNVDTYMKINIVLNQRNYILNIIKNILSIYIYILSYYHYIYPSSPKYKKSFKNYNTSTYQILYIKLLLSKQNVDNAILIPENLIQNITSAQYIPPITSYIITIDIIIFIQYWHISIKSIITYVEFFLTYKMIKNTLHFNQNVYGIKR